MSVKISLFHIIWLIASILSAQEVKINGGFVEDSMQVGEEVHFWLSARYHQDVELLFPDSLNQYTPFEYNRRIYSPTEIKDELLVDSAVYTLQSFEIDPVQILQLQILAIDELDTTHLTSPLDSIYFKDLVIQPSDTTSLIANTSYLNVPRQFNYPMLWILLGVAAIALLTITFLFGKKLLIKWKIYRLKKDYQLFNNQLTQYIRTLRENPSISISEHALVLWKSFMERIEPQPYTKLTTAEILHNNQNKELNITLKSIDRVIYGRHESPSVYKDFQSIEDFTQHRFMMKINELKNGASHQQ